MLMLILNHLWQSTLFAGAAGVLAWTLRKHSASVRAWIWCAASIKFLLPWSALMALGSRLHWRSTASVGEWRSVVWIVETMSRPLARTSDAALTPMPAHSGAWQLPETLPFALAFVWATGALVVLAVWLIRWHQVRRVVRAGRPVRDGRELALLRRLERARGMRAIELVSAETTIEPGVFGILRPVLLWPRGISARLGDGQIEAIFAHELSHVRRRDNLMAAVQMLVQAVFWFHPLVWWVGARIVDERERACDEDVLEGGSVPEVYAEGILRICTLCLESPLACMAGVTGSDLNARIVAIMSADRRAPLSRARKTLLTTAAMLAVTGPLAIGVVTASPTGATGGRQADGPEAFEVVSVKINPSGESFSRLQAQPGGRVTITNASLLSVMRTAFTMQAFQIVNGPDWLDRDRFDIAAKAEGNPDVARLERMLQQLLANRFQLKTRKETRELPVYSLVLARADRRLGPQIHQAEDGYGCAALRSGPPQPQLPDRANGRPACGIRAIPGSMRAGGISIAQLAATLGQGLGRSVINNTGLSGEFDVDLLYTPDQAPTLPPPPGVPAPPADGPSIFAALQEQLGLKVESTKGPVDVLVIEHVEHPTPD